jgi:amylosucrase
MESRIIHRYQRDSEDALKIILERLEASSRGPVPDALRRRLGEHFPRLFSALWVIYGQRWDFFFQLELIVAALVEAHGARKAELRELDDRREADPLWYRSGNAVGAMLYVDRFAGTLAGLREHLGYFEELGISYLHLMPLFRVPEGESDGGYAISSYREVDPRLGSMEELAELADEFRARGISLVLDFVFNHTSDEHDWALKAVAGEEGFREYYFFFESDDEKDEYDRHVREIFPDTRRGSFTWNAETRSWVWTTFNSFQWDLNYANPNVFRAMMGEMLFLANAGVEVLRLDALAFVWKEKGTSCENLPKAHTLISAFRIAAKIAAPALAFKSEAIVHPDEVAKYIHSDECELSYNPLMMALLWESLATKKATLLLHSLQKRYALPADCAWVNYVRSHDDIGWTFADEDAGELGMNGFDHRRFLNSWYTGRFDGSFARGVPFQYNPVTGDCRISGTCASLAGIEAGLSVAASTLPPDGELSDAREPEPAGTMLSELEKGIRRYLLLYGVIFSSSGVPLIYIGDEQAQLNWYAYRDVSAYAGDSRWVHRPPFDWGRAGSAGLEKKPASDADYAMRIRSGMSRMLSVRRNSAAFERPYTRFIDSGNEHILAHVTETSEHRVMVLTNFSEEPRRPDANLLRLSGFIASAEIVYCNNRNREGRSVDISKEGIELQPLEQLWMAV